MFSYHPSKLVKSSITRVSIAPDSGTGPKTVTGGASGNQLYFTLPGVGSRMQFILPKESYFSFRFTNTSTCTSYQGGRLDQTGSAIINTFALLQGSNFMEEVRGYNLLANVYHDFCMSTSDHQYYGSFMGNSPVLGVTVAAGATVADTEQSIARQGALLTTNSVLNVAVPLYSGLIGLFAEKPFPIGHLEGKISVRLTLENAYAALLHQMTTATALAPAYQLDEIYLHLSLITLPEELVMAFEREHPREISWHYQGFLHGNSNLTNTTRLSYIPSFSCESMRGLIYFLRHSDNTAISDDGMVSASLSSRACGDGLLTETYITIDGMPYPSNRLSMATSALGGSQPQVFFELMKTIGKLSNGQMGDCAINRTAFSVAGSTKADKTAGTALSNATMGGFCVGIDFDGLNDDNGGEYRSGMDTRARRIEIVFTGTAPGFATTIDCWAISDRLISIDERGTATVEA